MNAPIIDVRQQHKIPLGKAFALCLKGIAHRLFRSLLTLTVIVLAVAFFMVLLCESAFTKSVGGGVAVENAARRFASQRLAVWVSDVDQIGMAARLVAADGRPLALGEIAAVSGAQLEQVRALAAESRRESRVMAFFDGMDAGSRAILVRKSKGAEIFAYLADASRWTGFDAELAQLHALKPPMPLNELKASADGHLGYVERLAGLTQSWRTAVARLRDDLAPIDRAAAPDADAGGAGHSPPVLAQASADASVEAFRRRMADALAQGEAAFLISFQACLAAHGFADTPDQVRLVHDGLARAKRRNEVRDRLSTDECHAAWHKAFLEDPLIDKKMLVLDDQRVATILGGTWTPQQLSEISRDVAEENRLLLVEKAVVERQPPGQSGQGLISGRQAFLMAISFVVCMVGITNAMLMAITERFREIATMKCLGATDGFILQQFLMEASVQGFSGGLVGTAIGLVLALIKCSLIYGVYLFSYFPVVSVMQCGLICVGTGVALSTLASIYPSWSASRMAPMDAMRVE